MIIDNYKYIYRERGSKDFHIYRQLIYKCHGLKAYKTGWFNRELSKKGQQFYKDLISNNKPIYVIQTPPQHGKSLYLIDLISWVVGKNPELKTIYASFSQSLGIKGNRALQRILNSEIYNVIFPDFDFKKLTGNNESIHSRNNHYLEYGSTGGSFRNVTVEGAITGESLDFGIIDDPVKGRKAVSSALIRESTWSWFLDDFYSRFSENAGLLVVGTSWHVDDLISRVIIEFKESNITQYKAISETKEEFRDINQPLFPELKSLEFLQKRRKSLTIESWLSLYQQTPIVKDGEIFNKKYFRYYSDLKDEDFENGEIFQSWDTASKDKTINDPSCCMTFLKNKDGKYYIIDIFLKRVKYPELKRTVILLSKKYNPKIVLIEDKSSGTQLIQELNKVLKIIAINPKISKVLRAESCSELYESFSVYHSENAAWLEHFENELLSFPKGVNDDQVDALSQFLNWDNKGKKSRFNFG